jgi:hypothetical protein
MTVTRLEDLVQSVPPGPIDFEHVEVVPGFVSGTWILIVRGQKPNLNMEVTLSPVVYVQQPEYWEIHVVGHLPFIGLPVIGHYEVWIGLDRILGTEGIEVVGKDKREVIKTDDFPYSGGDD